MVMTDKPTPLLARRVRWTSLATVLVMAALTSCAEHKTPLPGPLAVNKPKSEQNAVIVTGDEAKARALSSSPGLSPPLGPTLAAPFSNATPPKLTGENIGVNFD